MTPAEIKAMYPKMDLVKFSKNNNSAITTAVEFTGNGYFIVHFATQNGRILQIVGARNGKKAFKTMPIFL